MPINPTRSFMFLFMPIVTPVTCRLAAAAAVDGPDATAVFVAGAPPGAGVR